jgi:hypothetical protein
MIDRWLRPEEPTPPQPGRAVLRPGDPDWRPRWLAAVRRRMQASPERQIQMGQARVAALATDASLWAELRAAELAYARGEGERFIPGQDAHGDAQRHRG